MGNPQPTKTFKYCGSILLHGDEMQRNFAYLAGLLDGEGTIGIYNESNGKDNPRRIRVRMVISSSTVGLMDYLKKTFDVRYIQKRNYLSHYGTKIMYHAVFNEHQILAFGEEMLPFLIIKHEKMIKCLNHLHNKKLRKKGVWK
jgi:hypothetical protein